MVQFNNSETKKLYLATTSVDQKVNVFMPGHSYVGMLSDIPPLFASKLVSQNTNLLRVWEYSLNTPVPPGNDLFNPPYKPITED